MAAFDNVGKLTDEMFDEITMIMAAEDIAEERGIDLYGYDELEEKAADRAARAAEASVEEVTAVVVVQTTSKKDQAIAIYNALEDKSRKSVMTALQAAGFGAATSSTYAANLRGGKWS